MRSPRWFLPNCPVAAYLVDAVNRLIAPRPRSAAAGGAAEAFQPRDAACRKRRHAWSRGEDADQVQRIHGCHADDLADPLEPAGLTQSFHRFGQRVLLAHEAGDEAAATRGAARLEPA